MFEASPDKPVDTVRDGSRDPALDGLRGIAVIAVMMFHFTMFERSTFALGKVALRIASIGWAGVDLFFALSGFLITGILLDSKGRPHFFRNFYVRRALRILPLYYAVLSVSMAVIALTWDHRDPDVRALFHHQIWLWTFSTNIKDALASHWVFNAGPFWLNHMWSLAVEEQFYLVWPLVVFFLDRRALARIALALFFAVPALRIVLVFAGVPPDTVYVLGPCRADTLALGGFAAIVLRDAALRERALPMAGRWLAGSVVLLGLIAWRRRGLYYLDGVVDAAAFSPIAVVSTVVLLNVTTRRGGVSRRLLENSFLVFFGKYSYAAYIFHYIFWPFLEKVWPAERLQAATGSEVVGLTAHVAIGVVLTVSAAFVSFHAFERHFLDLKRKFAATERVRGPAAVTSPS